MNSLSSCIILKISSSICKSPPEDALNIPEINELIQVFPGEPNAEVIFLGISLSFKTFALIASSISCDRYAIRSANLQINPSGE